MPLGSTTLSIDGHRYRGDVVAGTDPAGLAVVDRVGFEDYVDGIAEMPSRWPAAALQAQAVAARTYALWQVLTHPTGPAGGQICATDACQVYAGLAKEDGAYGGAWKAAVDATRGQVLLYGGRVIEALYGSSDGGSTVSGGVPWLPAVDDPDDGLAPEHTWSWSAPLASLGGVLGVPSDQTLVSLVSSPTAVTETLQQADGSTTTVALDPAQFRMLLNTKMAPPGGLDLPLPSGRYTVSTDATSVDVSGSGDGNGLGLSQYGALGKAERGASAGQILAAYYGPARAATLPAGEMPSTIGVTISEGAAAVAVSADGPVRVEGPDGRQVAATTGPGSWQVTGGVVVQATPTAATAAAVENPVAPPPPTAPAAAPRAPTTVVTSPSTTVVGLPSTTPPTPAVPGAVAAVPTDRLASAPHAAGRADRRHLPPLAYLLAIIALAVTAACAAAVGRGQASAGQGRAGR